MTGRLGLKKEIQMIEIRSKSHHGSDDIWITHWWYDWHIYGCMGLIDLFMVIKPWKSVATIF